MKKILALALILLVALSCAACGSSGEKDLLTEIKEQGYIELCTEPYFAPNEFIDPTKTGDEQYVGMDIEIAQYIADKIGVEIDYAAPSQSGPAAYSLHGHASLSCGL